MGVALGRGRFFGRPLRSVLVKASSSLIAPCGGQGIVMPRSFLSTDSPLVGLNGVSSSALPSTRGRAATNLRMQANSMVLNIHQTAQQIQTSLYDVFDRAILQMSSTLKKRRAKMNKHKLRKRRKLERRKSK